MSIRQRLAAIERAANAGKKLPIMQIVRVVNDDSDYPRDGNWHRESELPPPIPGATFWLQDFRKDRRRPLPYPWVRVPR